MSEQKADKAGLPTEAPSLAPGSDGERIRRLKRMAGNLAGLIVWPDENSFVRAGGLALCCRCGLRLIEHPSKNSFHLDCYGRLLKL